MAFVQFTKVSIAFGERDLLKEVSLYLASGTRAALTGANGSGKSTLMKIIAGILSPDSGERAVQKDSRLAYLPQAGIVHQGRSLYAEAESAFETTAQQLRRLDELGSQLQGSVEGAVATSLLDELQNLQEVIEASGWYDRQSRIQSVLSGLGFNDSDLDRAVSEFSGGWQMRIALAKLLLAAPDILLLDEPTNYLDIEARNWLEQWLRDFKGGYLVVSHDRYFLDLTVNEVYELFQGELKRYHGNFSAYESRRQTELAGLIADYEVQQAEIAKTEDFIRRFRYNASKAALVQDRIRRLEKLDRIEIPESLKRIRFSFPSPPPSGRLALSLRALGKSFGRHCVFKDLDLVIERGEKLGVVGRNGAGKTSLLRILAGVDPEHEGDCLLGTAVSVAYFSQDIAEAIDGNQSVLDYLEAISPTDFIPKLRSLAGAFLFRGDEIYKPINVLSGGEKTRLSLLGLLLKPANLLILDEPTNHLDLHSKDRLLEALQAFSGSLVFVSHDRGFNEALSTKTLELSTAGPRLFYGNYAYYCQRIAAEATTATSVNRPAATSPRSMANQTSPTSSQAAAGFAEDQISAAEYRTRGKQRQSQLRRLDRQEADLFEILDQLEAQKLDLNNQLEDPETYMDGEKSRTIQTRLAALESEIEATTIRWELIATKLEQARTTGA